ncbi:EamA family transporter [Rhodanobacter sp. AS-Z3]|uniref:DMT family transporter n=1 Tax=Rhodanobacter sp. AS-Z3 TaxID=3031330 RepID=UPI002478A2EE|nr:DMT family transporter [Rhodanobacter sp. AS-Z3]WEN14894.1 EamA family transporter [Rhodanobacter sp. AS-Z3]
MPRPSFSPAIAAAIAAALLFGASTPIAKQLLLDTSPVLLAGLLYLGSGVGLGLIRTARDRGWQAPAMTAKEWLWLLLAIGFGGVLGPVALLLGLTLTSAASASLLLNLEAVLTALLAWLVFRENADRRIVLGMALIVAGAVVLVVPGTTHGASMGWGAVLVAGACLCWALDNNFTRKVSASDALFIAGLKGLVAGVVNVAIALMLGARWPALPFVGIAMTVGLLGYGISLVLFVLALRGLGSARTGAYFSTAPFMGAAIAILAFGDHASPMFWLATALMGAGVWLHLTERHEHLHTHAPMTHSHRHVHDEHHQHAHDGDGSEPHTHEHTHTPLTHSHPHYPDIHHQHDHP